MSTVIKEVKHQEPAEEISSVIEPEPGIYNDIPHEEYHHAPEYKAFISSTGVRKLLKSAAHFKAHQTTESKPTPQMLFGSAAHYHVLEPEKEMVIVAPVARTSRKAFAEFEASQPKDKSIVSESEMQQLEGMRKEMAKHSLARSLIFNGQAEQSVFWNHTMFEDTKCKCRPDYALDDIKTIVDYKTTTDAGADSFAKAVINFGYEVQAAWYMDGMKTVSGEDYQFVFVAQEKEPPYAIAIYLLSRDFIERGQKLINTALTTHFYARQTKKWDGYPAELKELRPPAWAIL